MSDTTPESNTSAPSPRPPRSGSDNAPGESNSETARPNPEGNSSAEGGAPRKRRRGSRGGKNRNAAARAARSTGDNADTAHDQDGGAAVAESGPIKVQGDQLAQPAGSAEAGQSGTGRPPKPRRSPNRSNAVRDNAAKAEAEQPAPRVGDSKPVVVDATDDAEDHDGAPRKRRRRGGRRRGGAKTAVALAENESMEDVIELDEETLEKRRGKERNGRPVGRFFMCVQQRDKATQIAVLEGRNLIEHYVSRPHDDISQIDGNVYLSRVQNVLPGMEAAFIDIGTPKNAVLYRGDVRHDADDTDASKKPDDGQRIEQMIKAGQTIMCQVTKNPIGTKGARLTQEVSLPGRFVVLMPNNSTYGISKRLPDDERKRLRKVLDQVKPAEHGIIVRTAAEGVTEDELRRDVQRLLKQWAEIEAKAAKSKAPELLYREPDMAVRIIREEFNREYRGVIIDDKELFDEVHDYVASISPELADRIQYYNRETEPLPLFERYHVHEQLHKALDRKVWLPSGGSLIIERTEALTVIDVNTGKNVGKSNLEETVFKNNLEAAEEIAHQLRLRDIGGIIVIDFIDMEVKRNRDAVLEKLRDNLARDKTRTQAYPIGELGLVEMTRKRISEGLVESFAETCAACNGRGFVLDENLLSDD
jgi:ribonuclease E